MAWTPRQRALFAQACKAAGIIDEHRLLILQQVPGQRAIHQGRPSSRSPRLAQEDYEFAMATVEDYSGGQLRINDRAGEPRYAAGHWRRRLEQGPERRLRWLVAAIDEQLQRGKDGWSESSLGAWIARQTHAAKNDIAQLNYAELADLSHGLKAFARRHQVPLGADAA